MFLNLLKKVIKKILYLKYVISTIDYVIFCVGAKKYDLIIYDDIYPHPSSGFRLEEFTKILTEIDKSKIVISPKAYSMLNTNIKLHKAHIQQIQIKNTNLNGKLQKKAGIINLNTKLFYCIFINNIYQNLNLLEKHKIPFVFTLYPGGGFHMNSEQSDKMLEKVLKSPYFKKVIVTQNVIMNYLISKNFCSIDSIKLIQGGVVPQHSLFNQDVRKTYYKSGKDVLDICFCAGKYMPQGQDKGYDVFIELAIILANKYDFVKFHVIGGFDETDIDISEIKDKIKFYGYQKFQNLATIYNGIDIIISPNKSFMLNDGAFDGFPLGTVVEAALNGALAIVSDDLNQNSVFVNHEEIIIVKSDVGEIVKEVTSLIENPSKIIEIAVNGKSKFKEFYSNEVQITPRLDLLNEILKEL